MSAQDERTIDHARLAYPSDGLTLGTIRKTLPGLFAQDDPSFFEDVICTAHVSAMLHVERQLAHKAFAAALKRPDPYPSAEDSRRELIRLLSWDYKRFGLSPGRQHTMQLVRGFEAAAAAQAQEPLGTGRA